jgi:AcrR family transcriptional regulator
MWSEDDSFRRRLIKEVALKLFSQFGFHKTSLEEIATNAGIKKQSIYYYYPNKEAIFDEIVLETARELLQNVDQKMDPNLPAIEKFLMFTQLIYEELKNHAKQIGKVVTPDFIEYTPHGRPIVDKIRLLLKDRLRVILKEGKEQGVFNIENEELTLDALMEMANFIRMRWLIFHDEKRCDQIVREMNRIVLDGLKVRKDQ